VLLPAFQGPLLVLVLLRKDPNIWKPPEPLDAPSAAHSTCVEPGILQALVEVGQSVVARCGGMSNIISKHLALQHDEKVIITGQPICRQCIREMLAGAKSARQQIQKNLYALIPQC